MSARPPRREAEGGRREAEGAVSPSPATSRPDDNTQHSVAGVVGDVAATRSGDDVRRRGWFWHWNSIVTQFAPLIGLKGIGLLNSYTVWTDRREESPHRGYAFPSQQREADFYGEDRAELITINKILVALDLIEIRKEMVLRVDEQGRRWRVPHNFYRVKDHGDGFVLGSRDVMRVVDLADRDQSVYRYVRHIFSARFAPIDADNVWVRILAELRQTEVWQRLAARTAHEEDRASARTRAGHAARKAGQPRRLGMPERRDMTTPTATQNDSVCVASDGPAATLVATINNGSDMGVAPANKGFDGPESTAVAPANTGWPTSVGASNRTYDQPRLTTTTIDERPEETDWTGNGSTIVEETLSTSGADISPTPVVGAATTQALTAVHIDAGPGGRPAPADAAGEAAAIRAFEDANGRRSTPAERQLLRGLAERFDPAARDHARLDLPSGWSWLTAAIYEAVEAGSSFVAPRRLREFLSRWEREGTEGGRRKAEGGRGDRRPTQSAPSPPAASSVVPDIPLPHGFGSRRTWEFTLALLGTAIERERLAELLAGTAIVGYRDGEVTLAVPDAARAERIAGEYRELIARKLSEAMRRPVRLAVLTNAIERRTDRRIDGQTDPASSSKFVARSSPPTTIERSDEDLPIPAFVVAECGLPSAQVWAAVLEELAVNGGVGRADFDAWLRTTALIGRGEGGSLVIGVPHALAQRRIVARFLGPLRAAVAAVVGVDGPIDVVIAHEWLRAQTRRDADSAPSPRRSLQEGA